MSLFFRRLNRDRRGATAIEFGLLAGLIAIAALAGFNAFGESLENMWDGVKNESVGAMG
ncbi:Flp family type IVb pilin [Pacificimonas flava]|uniref:Flp family type IVb pilin n=1 Tax=Pacificimonas flava TaxID=1234595 RepID=M2U339_9SPHN|nr:Flp family type IVb pilin [Pacificimonas flava]EMD82397.1 hypothetical protein C725_2118 [Pacificimonas flava]MBB5281231.1 pilus assembly protein Flp/PilA [Pacificimonas flava]